MRIEKTDKFLLILYPASALLDFLTTIIGINFFNLTETNPLGVFIPSLLKGICCSAYFLSFYFVKPQLEGRARIFFLYFLRIIGLGTILVWSYCGIHNIIEILK